MEKNVRVTKNIDHYKFCFQLFFNFLNNDASYKNILKNINFAQNFTSK